MKTKSSCNKHPIKIDECEQHLDVVKRSIRTAILEISAVVIAECPGIENQTPTRITELRSVLNTLADIRDKHFSDRHGR